MSERIIGLNIKLSQCQHVIKALRAGGSAFGDHGLYLTANKIANELEAAAAEDATQDDIPTEEIKP